MVGPFPLGSGAAGRVDGAVDKVAFCLDVIEDVRMDGGKVRKAACGLIKDPDNVALNDIVFVIDRASQIGRSPFSLTYISSRCHFHCRKLRG